ncbi:MAG TPA: hypothetical protein PKD52_05130 [Clostridiales bacterium]|nr:hypothetical protein [Clostridiales bacterium]
MKKVLKWFMTALMPLLLLMGSAWILSHASYDNLIYYTDHYLLTFSDWQYWVRILLYGTLAVYLFYLYQTRYAKKELAVLAIPIFYLVFFSLPTGVLESNVTLLTLYHRFYSGLSIPVLLLFAYLVKTVATALTWTKDSKQQEKEGLPVSPVMEENAFE